jgi:ribA/ribD-fused uncharacterized protein
MEDNPLGIVLYINKDSSVRHLSNFSRHKVQVDGKIWPSSEHYFQAAKFFKTDPEWAEAIRQVKWPSEAKSLGNDRSHPIDLGWDKGVAASHMLIVLFEKALQNKDVYDQLMATNDVKIVERADWDAIWGDGPNRDGKNLLGKLWMVVRDTLRNQ